MADNENVNEPAFVLNEPDEETQKMYPLSVSFLGFPKMWFKDPDDAHDVHQQLLEGYTPEYLQQNMKSGQGWISQGATTDQSANSGQSANSQNTNERAFLLCEPDGETRKRYPHSVEFKGFPKMWFKDPNDAHDVRQRLLEGYSPEFLQNTTKPGQSVLYNEYGGPLRENQSAVSPLDNLRLLTTPGSIVDFQPQTKDGYGYSVYTDRSGNEMQRSTLPPLSEMDKQRMAKGIGLVAGVAGGFYTGKVASVVANDILEMCVGYAAEEGIRNGTTWAVNQIQEHWPWKSSYQERQAGVKGPSWKTD